MARLSVRVTKRTLERLDELALARKTTRAALVRRLVEGAIDGVAIPPSEAPDRDELLALMSERAREGNVAAIRALLARRSRQTPASAR